MKRIKINEGRIGLVFQNGSLQRMLTVGNYWLGFFETIKFYDLSKQFFPAIDLNILLKNEELASYLEVVEVGDSEIVLKHENGNFREVLTAGRYAFWKGVTDYKFTRVDLSKFEITEDIPTAVLQRREVLPYIRVFVVENYEKGMLFVDGKFVKALETGVYYFWKNAVAISVKKADFRKLQTEVLGQEILTKDKAAIRANFVVQYRIIDMQKALIETADFAKQLYVLAQLALREYLSGYTLDEILEKKDDASEFIKSALAKKVDDIGLEIIETGIKDIILPGDVKEIMNRVLIAQKQAQANTITRREETASTRSLLNTAKLMESNEMLFKLKEMEYVEKIADKVGGITVSGNGKVLEQLRDIFSTK